MDIVKTFFFLLAALTYFGSFAVVGMLCASEFYGYAAALFLVDLLIAAILINHPEGN